MSILKDYDVEFFNKVNLGKSLSTKNQILTSSIFDHYNPRKANQLLDDINDILSGVSLEIPTFMLPTNDFKIIVEARRDYLIQQ